jgi:hypothetical protein
MVVHPVGVKVVKCIVVGFDAWAVIVVLVVIKDDEDDDKDEEEDVDDDSNDENADGRGP